MDSFFTPIRVESAQDVLIARAFLHTLNKQFLQWSADILTTGTYHYAGKFYTTNPIKGLPADRIIRDPNHIDLMEGTGGENANGWQDTDKAKYYEQLHIKAVRAGYLHAENADRVAAKELHDAEETFLKLTVDTHQYYDNKFASEQQRTEVINRVLNLFHYFLNNQNLTLRSDLYCNRQMIHPVTTDPQNVDHEISFQMFTAGRRYLPVLAMQDFADIPEIGEIVKLAKGVWWYNFQSFFFEMETGKQFHFDGNRTTAKYIHINPLGEVFESNNLEEIERYSFEQHLLYYNG